MFRIGTMTISMKLRYLSVSHQIDRLIILRPGLGHRVVGSSTIGPDDTVVVLPRYQSYT